MNGPQADGPSDALAKELREEQHHVDRVYALLEVAQESARAVERDGLARYQSDRADFLREEDGTALFERDAFAFQAAKRLAALDASHEGLVFGRIDTTEPDTRYIGRIGVRDNDYEPLVIDWRAPAAEPFYRATPNNPMGVIRRRVLRCRGQRVIGLEDDLLDGSAESNLVVLGEGALMAALTRARGHQMRDIVATIQAEQDAAIRAPYPGVTIIAGGPGTGKTVVALHRAAYLLYSHRKRLEKGGVLVVGPSSVFMNYIERVLPSLGEDSVTLTSIGAAAKDVLRLAEERVDSAEAATLKGSLRLLPVLRRLVDIPFGPAATGDLRVSVKGEILTLDAARASRMRIDVLRHHKANQARPMAESAALNHLWSLLSDSVEVDRETFDELVTSQPAWRMFMNAWWPTLHATELLHRLGDRQLLDQIAGGLTSAERDQLAASYHNVSPEKDVWSVADVALLDELAALLGPAPHDPDADVGLFIEGGDNVPELVTMADLLRDQREADEDPLRTFAHVLVDEAQDVTPMQWRMLRRRGPQASWTLVGDPAQSSYPASKETQQAILDLIGRAPSRTFRLSTNYRSPKEVFDLAAKVIRSVFPGADLPTAVRSTDVQPLLADTTREHLMTSLNDHVATLSKAVEGTIGIICPPSLLDAVTSASGAMPALAASIERVSILTALQSKGLEYDAVIVVSPDEIIEECPNGKHVLYVALTRPTQRLVTLDLVQADAASWRDALHADLLSAAGT